MLSIRRWYIYLVSAISLQTVAWAAIVLLRNLLPPGPDAPLEAVAFQIAVIVVGLPLFLVHWMWAQRLAGRDPAERGSSLRRFYLYAMMAGFLLPFLANADGLVGSALVSIFGLEAADFDFGLGRSAGGRIVDSLIAIVVLGSLWIYQKRQAADDDRTVPESDTSATIRRLYIFLFAGAGLLMASLASTRLLRWILFQFGADEIRSAATDTILSEEIARLVVGLPLWLIFWRWAQRLFASPDEGERSSALRKLYLYLAVFVAVFTAVTNVTLILAGLFRKLLALPPQGDIRGPLPLVLGTALAWAYHALIIKGDAEATAERPGQALVRRLYFYLVAAIGLGAFLVGLSGDISVLIRALDQSGLVVDLKEQLAWFTAALIAGLPVWALSWRRLQIDAGQPDEAGQNERRSIVRRIFLYFYIFVATMTVLSSAVYIVSQVINLALGGREATGLLSDVGQAAAFILIAVAVWLYHGLTLRGDGQRSQEEENKQLASWKVAILDPGDGTLGRALLEGLRREAPGVKVQPIGLSAAAAAAMNGPSPPEKPAELLGDAGIIVGPWIVAVPGAAQGAVTAELAEAVALSSARKLLVPVWADAWEWAGVERWERDVLVNQTIHAVRQVVAGEEVKPDRPLGAGTIIVIVIGILFLAIMLVDPILSLFIS